MTAEQFFLRLRQQYLDRLPFAVHNSSSSSHTITALLQKNEELFYTDDFTESGFVFAPFDNRKQAVLLPAEVSERLSTSIPEFPVVEVKEEVKIRKDQDLKDCKEVHLTMVRKALRILKTGAMDKVVLSRREEVALNEPDPLKLFKELLKYYPTAFVYCWYHPQIGLWLGATPETLLKVKGNQFKTMALAGTQRFHENSPVEWGEKEKQEQQFVTDSILESLSLSSAENIETTAPFTDRAGSLLHIRTDITGTLSNSIKEGSKWDSPARNIDGTSPTTGSLKRLISTLHPTPAVCGLPKKRAKVFILENELYDREFYTGFLGELNQQQVTQRSRSRRNVENLAYRAVRKETSLFVNLRCMKIEAGKAVLFMGGGITKDSIPENEWYETVNKAGTMKKVLFK